MPILVSDYRWSETHSMVHIDVPLKGVNGAKADIFCTEEFIKVNYPPFLFESLLFAPIDDVKSSAKIHDNCVRFLLHKKEPEMWNRLLSLKADDKKYVLKKKLEAIEYAQKKSEEIQSAKLKLKDQSKKYSMKEMMRLEKEERERIAGIKEEERDRAMGELSAWKEQKRKEAEAEQMLLLREREDRWKKTVKKSVRFQSERIRELEDEAESRVREIESGSSDDEEFEIIDEHEHGNAAENGMGNTVEKGNADEIFAKSDADKDEAVNDKAEDNKKKKPTSGPRQPGNISVAFTPRVFPTPVRESNIEKENEWLQKQADARKRAEIDDPDLAEHEKDPVWLKDKAGQLYGQGNYLGSVNAYNLAIKIQPRMPILYLNRAACHLKLRNLYKCAEDSSSALDLMQPAVDANSRGRLKAHLRRAAAFCELELYVEALQDYEAALKIDPKNEVLIEDAKKIRTVVQSSSG